ncbi:hypothetical protein KEM55_006102, partial [Ascosphaera atra]
AGDLEPEGRAGSEATEAQEEGEGARAGGEVFGAAGGRWDGDGKTDVVRKPESEKKQIRNRMRSRRASRAGSEETSDRARKPSKVAAIRLAPLRRRLTESRSV